MKCFNSQLTEIQIGCRFWDLARQEHRNYNKNNIYDEPISAFFRNVDQNMNDIHVGDGSGKIQQLKARVGVTAFVQLLRPFLLIPNKVL